MQGNCDQKSDACSLEIDCILCVSVVLQIQIMLTPSPLLPPPGLSSSLVAVTQKYSWVLAVLMKY